MFFDVNQDWIRIKQTVYLILFADMKILRQFIELVDHCENYK